MHDPDETDPGSGQAVAIVGAALRFPGAADPSSFHELTVAGRRMFRDLAAAAGGATPGSATPGGAAAEDAGAFGTGHGGTGRPPPARAALLDNGSGAPGRDGDLPHGVTARHVLAAETAAAALADVPAAGRDVAPERIGVFIADIPEPGTADVRDWVRRQLGLIQPGDDAESPVGRHNLLIGHNGAIKHAGGSVHGLILGTIGLMGRRHPVAPLNGTSLNGAGKNGSGNGNGHGNGVGNGNGHGNGVGKENGNSKPLDGLYCSLRAVTAACDALNAGEFDLVLAGGVAKGVGAWVGDAPAEHIRVYDASPTGTLPGEGCGFVALLRAADARAEEVPGYAEIVGWHAASPATSHRATLPAAYLHAGIDPADIQFIEGHGAATAADDLAELTALLEVLGTRAEGTGYRCALGSVSANIGDTRAAAGVAALLKTAFAMTEDVIPPSTGCVRPNLLLRGDTAPFRLPAAAEQWPQTPVQLAAVNTLGTAPRPDAPRSGPVHVVLRRDRDPAHRPGRRRKPVVLPAATAGTREPSEPG